MAARLFFRHTKAIWDIFYPQSERDGMIKCHFTDYFV